MSDWIILILNQLKTVYDLYKVFHIDETLLMVYAT